eukprot:12144047-Prorocentrum_lima.AAC.1
MMIRRRHDKVGPNFDAVVRIDPTQPHHVQYFWRYIRGCKPICGVSAPPCTGLKGFSALNRIIAPDAWHMSRYVSIPLGNLA